MSPETLAQQTTEQPKTIEDKIRVVQSALDNIEKSITEYTESKARLDKADPGYSKITEALITLNQQKIELASTLARLNKEQKQQNQANHESPEQTAEAAEVDKMLIQIGNLSISKKAALRTGLALLLSIGIGGGYAAYKLNSDNQASQNQQTAELTTENNPTFTTPESRQPPAPQTPEIQPDLHDESDIDYPYSEEIHSSDSQEYGKFIEQQNKYSPEQLSQIASEYSLKPENLLVNSEGSIMVIDPFGTNIGNDNPEAYDLNNPPKFVETIRKNQTDDVQRAIKNISSRHGLDENRVQSIFESPANQPSLYKTYMKIRGDVKGNINGGWQDELTTRFFELKNSDEKSDETIGEMTIIFMILSMGDMGGL